jgi:hypothetical protein
MPLPEFKGEEFEFPDEKEAKGKPQEPEFEIEIEDDTPEADRGRKPAAAPVDEVTDEELASYDEKVQKRIKKFTRGYHDERRAKEEALREREAAETFARQVYEENKRLQARLESGSKVLVEQSKTAAQKELESAKEQYKRAFEAGDPDAIVQAQEAIAKAAVKVDKTSSMKPIKAKEPEFAPPPPRQEQAAPNINPRTKQWLDKNSSWFGVEEDMTSMAMGLDRKLQREYGADYIGTEEYFRTIDATMRKRFPEHFDDGSYEEETTSKTVSKPDVEEAPRRATRPANVVAPAARSTPPGRIRLKQSEVATARRLGVPIEEYARQVALLRNGD